MKFTARIILLTLMMPIGFMAFSQDRMSHTKFVSGRRWITNDILSDTITLTRIRPFKKYGLISMISFNKADFSISYGYAAIPKKSFWICGTGELDVDAQKSNYKIISNERLAIEIYASTFSDKSYYYHYIKEFRCEQVTKDIWRLIATEAKINEVKMVDFN